MPFLAAAKHAGQRAAASAFGHARRLPGKSACVALIGLVALLAPDALESAAANGDTRTIYLYHAHRKDSIAATFRVNGHYDAQTLDQLNYFLRDWRTDDQTKMDPRLFDVLWEAYRTTDRMGPDDPIIVMSAYRCPSTNAMLRRRSRAVAEHSQHMLGKAMDTSIPGLSMERLREIGMRMQRGGVGYYPNAGTPFVHLDVGEVRHWPRMNYDQLARLFPDGKTVHIPSNGKPMEHYEEARAEILARGGEAATIAEATSGPGIFGFFAKIFGGGEDEEEARQVGRVARPTRVAYAKADAARQAAESPQRRMVASAEADLPRGETYMGAPDDAGPGRQAVSAQAAPQPAAPQSAAQSAALQPAPAAARAPAPDDASQTAAEDDAPANVPTPPRRPDNLVASIDAPLPPPRPAELARLPDIITRGASSGAAPASTLALRPSHTGETAALAYAAAPSAAAAPLPPPRPPLTALRAAAVSKAEEQRAAKAVAAQITPARMDRAALQAMAAPAPQHAVKPANGAGFAPALRSAAKLDALAASPPPRGVKTGFGDKATVLSVNTFTRDDD